MAIPALGSIASALVRAIPMAAQGISRFAVPAASGVSRGLGATARQNNQAIQRRSLDNPDLGKINNEFKFLGKNIKSLHPIFQRLNKAFQFMGKLFRSLQQISILSSSSINSLSASLIGMIPIVGKTAQRFVLFAEEIADTIVNTFTNIPRFLESKFSGIISLIRSYSPAQAKQIEIAFGQLRATIGQVLTPLAPMIRNVILNIARLIKDNASKIDIKKLFKWIVFFMFLAVGVVIAGVKFLMKQMDKIRFLMNIGYHVKDVLTLGPQRRQLSSAWNLVTHYTKKGWEKVTSFVGGLFGGKKGHKDQQTSAGAQSKVSGEGDFYHGTGAGGSFDDNWEGLTLPGQMPSTLPKQQTSLPKEQTQVISKQVTKQYDPYSPEAMMRKAAGFFRGIPGMRDFADVFSEMSDLFEKLFEPVDKRGLPFEATTSTATSVEEIGRQAREAALGVNKKPEEETARSTKETSKNTEDIRQGVQGLVSALPQGHVDDLVREVRLHIKAIRALDKNNMKGMDAERQEQALVIEGIGGVIELQEKANELLMRIADNQRLVAEMERSKNYSFGKLNNQRA